ncbi:D-alanyl-D-alanine carboxypeptidase [Irregularibacter muris]|uniref:serine-type D-Ala-D-Ala carboxypeptidase n=1 Tax=Irregularibacter muris TaxID=1796619 RepID=A0AAE3HCX6_9FIRM|nr:D-alanyl-D-alanine carboxypeptidase family protein [Irregularibacter muris]MCR1897936.1 D-alanyl-D-alanine carboxypeptidase [Irregularibacter muris]
MKRTIGIILLLIFLFGFTGIEALATEDNQPSITVSAEGAVLIEQGTGEVLFQKEMDKKMYPASTTKIMTALLAIEYGDLDEVVTLGKEVESISEDSSRADLFAGQKLPLSQLLYGLMLPSGNDAANAIAVHIAKKTSNNPSLTEEQAIKEFAQLMNKKVKEIGAEHTHFVNPHGYHDEDHYTTPLDMAMISREAMKNQIFRKIVKTPQLFYRTSKDLENNEEEERSWQNSNELIQQGSRNFYPYAQGIKTGRTTSAGRCLVSSAVKEDVNVIAVVFKSTEGDVWGDSTKLLSYGIENFKHHVFAQKEEIITKVKIKNAHPKDPKEMEIITEKDIKGLIKKEDIPKVNKKIESEDNQEIQSSKFQAPIEKGEKVGEITYFLGDKVVAKGNLVAKESIRKKGFFKAYWWIFILALPILFIIMNRNAQAKRRKNRARRKKYRFNGQKRN